ncbi:MAG: twin-arginine translocase subunit TatB [Sphingomonadales bacterium]|nr:twin-arginine translocase subunit TatB [Sphingomonadales bacterium]MDE2567615.1 twin-arginine translocase subunit TatB [Sphingomonadales bacterium]
MFDIGASELLLIVVVAIVVIGPKDLPLAMRTAGRWIARMRRVSNHFRSGIEAMIREAELEEMEKKWQAHNAAIMEQDAHNSASANAAAPAMEPLPPAAQSELPPEPVMPEQVAEPAAPAEAKPEGPA